MRKIFKKNIESFEQFSNYSTSDVQFKTGLFKLSFFYSINDPRKKYLIACLMGVILSIITTLLVEVTGLYSSGLTAFFQGVSRAIYVALSKNEVVDKYWLNVIYNLMFWGFYLLINLFLFKRYFSRMCHQCIYISAIFICTMQLCGFLWSFIPGLHSIMLFGDTSTVNEALKEYNVQSVLYSPNWYPTVLPNGQYDWNNLISSSEIQDPNVLSNVNSLNICRGFLLILYASIYAVPSSYINSALFIMGGSSGGTELTSLYLSDAKNKDLSIFLKTLQATTMFAGVFVGTYLSGIIINPEKYYGWQYLFNANFVGSFVWVFLNSLLVGKFFPSRKLVRVEIFTSDLTNILANLKKYKYTHPTTIVNSIGGFLANKNNILITVMQLTEIPNFVHIVRLTDKNSLISVTNIDDCDGRVGLQKVGIKSKKDNK